MTEPQIAITLELIAVLGLCSIVVFKIFPTVRVDSYRQKMFSIRDRLFDYAAAGNISFDHPAYRLLRRQMNGLIRFGHQLSVFRLVMLDIKGRLSADKFEPSFQESWEQAVAKIDSPEVREAMLSFHRESSALSLKCVALASPSIWLAILIAAIPLTCLGAAKGVRQLFRVAASKVLIGPLDARHIDQAASHA